MDTETSIYRFRTFDIDKYPPGRYGLQITAQVRDDVAGAKSVNFTIVLQDPCPTVKISPNEQYFKDMTYRLRDAEMSQTWLERDLYTIDTRIDCGQTTVLFFNDDRSPLNSDLFTQRGQPTTAFVV